LILPASSIADRRGNGQETIRLGHGVAGAKGTKLLGYLIACTVARLQCIHPERLEAADNAAGGRQGETGEANLATVTDVALIGCGGSGWRWRMNLLNSMNRFISSSILEMPG